MQPAPATIPDSGWQAGLELGFRATSRRTVLAERRRYGPLAVQRPFYPEGGVCHVYLLHPPGGMVGGDSLDIGVTLGEGAHALLTTPGAAKFYRSNGGLARQSQHFAVADGASLEWLPQENIFFPGTRARLETKIELVGDARLAWWEVHCLGRPVIDEAFDSGWLDSALCIERDGQPLVAERLRLDPQTRRRLSSTAGLPVVGSLLFSHATAAELDACRLLIAHSASDEAAATLLDDILVVRYLGDSTETARRLFTAVWQRLRPALLGHRPAPPRIWAT
jgi:urease accessory protein